MSVGEVRVRRPASHEVLIKHLQDEAGFPYMRDVLLFAAGVGVFHQRRVPFERAGEPIRYDTLTEPGFSGAFLAMMAACSIADPEILDGGRLQERVSVLEEYANGGLELIQEQMNVRGEPLDVVVRGLVMEALTDSTVVEPASIEELLEGL